MASARLLEGLKRPLFDTSGHRSATGICKFLESGENSVFYDHTKSLPPARMTGIDEVDRKNRDAGTPRSSELDPSPLEVGVGCCIYDISDVDARAGTFCGYFRLMLKWYVPSLTELLKTVNIARDKDRTPIPLSSDEWKSLTAVDVSQYRSFAKKIAVPSFALNTVDGDPVFTQRYAYVAETTDHPDIITMQLVFRSKFKMMEDSPMRFYPFDEAQLDFKIRLWDNKRDGARFFKPLRFPDGTHLLYPLKMNLSLAEWTLCFPALRLYRQGGMKGENATGPSVFSMSLIAKRRPHKAFGKTVAINGALTLGLLLLSSASYSSVRDSAVLLFCGLKTLHGFRTVSPHLDTPIADTYIASSVAVSLMLASEILGLGSSGQGVHFASVSLTADAVLWVYAKLTEYSHSRSSESLPQSTWNQEMGVDFDHRNVTFH